MKYFLAALGAYLFGSIPWALVIGKVFYNTDVREHGSGNLGGTNAGRVLGKKAGITVIVLDALKALIAVLVLSFIDSDLAIIGGMFTALGHCFPLYANFKGGKAVATNFGYIIAVSLFINHNFAIQALVPIIIFFIILLISKMVSLSAIIGMLSATLIAYTQPSRLTAICITIIVALSIYRHKENIKRIINHEERKVNLFK